MSHQLQYRHSYHQTQWTQIDWPYGATPKEAALSLSEQLSSDWADDQECEMELQSILDDIEVRHEGKVLEF